MVLCRTVYLLAVAAALQEVSGYSPDISEVFKDRIYNGHSIPIEDAPYMAALQRIHPGEGLEFFCGASIIHERFLLTAAHCFEVGGQKSLKYLPTIASIGSRRYMYTNTNTIIAIEKVLCHEGYNETPIQNDICLLKLKKPVRFGNRIAKIKLADNFNVKAGTEVNVSGWGKTEGFPGSLDLLRTTIPVLSNKYCQKVHNSIDDTMICAGVKGNGACYGDSGGPLVYNNIQIGVVSYGLPPRCASGMEVYAKVNSYMDWIHTTIAKNL